MKWYAISLLLLLAPVHGAAQTSATTGMTRAATGMTDAAAVFADMAETPADTASGRADSIRPAAADTAVAVTPADTFPARVAGAAGATPPPDSTASPYYRRLARYRRRWQRIIPNQYVVQYAGSIGFMSFGTGWHYGRRDSWETEVLLGIVPRYHSEKTKATLTLRQRYVPWHLPAGRHWRIEPLTGGLFFSSIFGEDFWAREPSRYPKKYYGFSTKVRANVFLGQRVKYIIPRTRRRANKSVSLYYELSSNELYIITAVTNKAIRLRDILSLAIGARFEVF